MNRFARVIALGFALAVVAACSSSPPRAAYADYGELIGKQQAAEANLISSIAATANACTDVHRAMARMRTEHVQALLRAEELGFSRGIKDSGKCPCAGGKRSIELGEKLFQFASLADWADKGQAIWKKHGVTGSDTLCIDQLGRVCGWGKHFTEAEQDDAYPIEVFRLRASDLRPAKKNEKLARWRDAWGKQFVAPAGDYTPGQFSPTGAQMICVLDARPITEDAP